MKIAFMRRGKLQIPQLHYAVSKFNCTPDSEWVAQVSLLRPGFRAQVAPTRKSLDGMIYARARRQPGCFSEFWRARSDCHRLWGHRGPGFLRGRDRRLRFRTARVWHRDECPGPRQGKERAWMASRAG